MEYPDELAATVARVTPRLLRVSDEAAGRRPGAGKWSAKELIGHLIDSACNNHHRFVQAHWEPRNLTTAVAPVAGINNHLLLLGMIISGVILVRCREPAGDYS